MVSGTRSLTFKNRAKPSMILTLTRTMNFSKAMTVSSDPTGLVLLCCFAGEASIFEASIDVAGPSDDVTPPL